MLGGLLYLTQLRNVGAAFSFAEGATVLFSLIAVVVAVVIVRSARRMFSTGWAVALGLVLGGALGNLIDRIFRDPASSAGEWSTSCPSSRPTDGCGRCSTWPTPRSSAGASWAPFLALRGIEFDGTRARPDGRCRGGDGGRRDGARLTVRAAAAHSLCARPSQWGT